MYRIPLLPKWVLPSVSSSYDLESATISEMVPKLYGAMRNMIEDYNKFVDEITTEVSNFSGSTTAEIENFKKTMEERLRCKFNDIDSELHKIRLELKQHTDTTLEKAFDVFGVTAKVTVETITLTDATDEKIRALSIYGKTTQRWDPVPEYPADLQSVGDSGSVTVKITNGTDEQQITLATPDGLPGIPVQEGGNYTDPTGQSWICDEIDLKRGVRVQRIKIMQIPDNFAINKESNELWIELPYNEKCVTNMAEKLCSCSHFPSKTRQETYANGKVENYNGVSVNGSVIRIVYNAKFNGDAAGFNAWIRERQSAGDPVKIAYILETPVDHPLTAAELAAYKKLHTYMHDTTISNGSGAAMLVEYVAITQNYMENRMQQVTTETATDIINRKIADGSLAVALQYNPSTEEMNIVTQEV